MTCLLKVPEMPSCSCQRPKVNKILTLPVCQIKVGAWTSRYNAWKTVSPASHGLCKIGDGHTTVEVLIHLCWQDTAWLLHLVPEHKQEFIVLFGNNILPKQLEKEVIAYRAKAMAETKKSCHTGAQHGWFSHVTKMTFNFASRRSFQKNYSLVLVCNERTL